VQPDAPNGAVSLEPALPAGWSGMALRRLRVGRSTLDLRLRRRPDRLVLRVRKLTGPSLLLSVGLPGTPAESVSVDDVELAGPRARFEVAGEHEVELRLPL
jgi:hypothetical protein